jgi:NAD+ synthase (glutamine-hydrolysing)
MKLTIGLAQISPRLGDLKANLDKHLQSVEQALEQGIQLLMFPELSLTGYMLQDLAHDTAIAVTRPPEPDDALLAPLVEASRKLDLVVGFAERDVRGRLFTASAYLSQGRIVHVHRKVYLPTYGMFDEGRDFDWGEEVCAFDTRFGRAGLLICEDFWHASPPYLLWLDGADLMLLTSASPGRGLDHRGKLSSSRFVELVNQAYANLFGCFVVHVNRVGFEDGVNFWGGSTVFGPDGELIAQAPYFEEALLATTLDLSALRRARARLPLLRDERPELTQRELGRILSAKRPPN